MQNENGLSWHVPYLEQKNVRLEKKILKEKNRLMLLKWIMLLIWTFEYGNSIPGIPTGIIETNEKLKTSWSWNLFTFSQSSWLYKWIVIKRRNCHIYTACGPKAFCQRSTCKNLIERALHQLQLSVVLKWKLYLLNLLINVPFISFYI